MLQDNLLIKGCKNHDRIAQKALYEKYAPVMRGLCTRYASNCTDVKDLLQEGFIKIFLNINQYSGKGSFEGWMKRIMINTAIKHYYKNKRNLLQSESVAAEERMTYLEYEDEAMGTEKSGYELVWLADFTQEELLDSLSILEDAYRIVFNLFFIEDFSHKEIACVLKIDEKTSRSRLFRARAMIQKNLFSLSKEKLRNKA